MMTTTDQVFVSNLLVKEGPSGSMVHILLTDGRVKGVVKLERLFQDHNLGVWGTRKGGDKSTCKPCY